MQHCTTRLSVEVRLAPVCSTVQQVWKYGWRLYAAPYNKSGSTVGACMQHCTTSLEVRLARVCSTVQQVYNYNYHVHNTMQRVCHKDASLWSMSVNAVTTYIQQHLQICYCSCLMDTGTLLGTMSVIYSYHLCVSLHRKSHHLYLNGHGHWPTSMTVIDIASKQFIT